MWSSTFEGVTLRKGEEDMDIQMAKSMMMKVNRRMLTRQQKTSQKAVNIAMRAQASKVIFNHYGVQPKDKSYG